MESGPLKGKLVRRCGTGPALRENAASSPPEHLKGSDGITAPFSSNHRDGTSLADDGVEVLASKRIGSQWNHSGIQRFIFGWRKKRENEDHNSGRPVT